MSQPSHLFILSGACAYAYPPLPKITPPSYPDLEKWPASTYSLCNEQASAGGMFMLTNMTPRPGKYAQYTKIQRVLSQDIFKNYGVFIFLETWAFFNIGLQHELNKSTSDIRPNFMEMSTCRTTLKCICMRIYIESSQLLL